MDGTSYEKLLAAGFGRWKRLGVYPTQAETKRIWDKLMEDPKNIGD